MLRRVKRLLARIPRSDEFRECRRCGTTIDLPSITCPACGSREIARYDL